MGEFFKPPPVPLPEQAKGSNPPPWTRRPHGPPLGEAASDLLLGRSESATVHISHIDAFPEGFELQITATASVADSLLRRGSERHVHVFDWTCPEADDEVIPLKMLRVGVQFADGRAVTNIPGYDEPLDGPIMSSLGGGQRGGRGDSQFHQGYWISPLPPPGPVTIVCEWPAVRIPLVRREIDGQLILDAADRARAMFPDGHRVTKNGREWRLGTDGEVAWINQGTIPGSGIAYAIPPVFASYCTLEIPETIDETESVRHEHAVIELLTEQTHEQPWWLGYLDTGASDVVFPYTPRTMLYAGYGYVLVEAGPQQATSWREQGFNWTLPDLIFPADRSWLLSTMWDDGWTSIGGAEQFVDRILSDPILGPRARRVTADEDPTPPGHERH